MHPRLSGMFRAVENCVNDRADNAVNDPRVYFAAERTLLAWIRTGLALMGFGFVVARFGLFLREVAPSVAAAGGDAAVPRGRASLWFGVALVAAGVIVNTLAAIDHRQVVSSRRRSSH